MLKIVAKLVGGLAKALAPTVICHKLWTMVGWVPQLPSPVTPSITASATSLSLKVSTGGGECTMDILFDTTVSEK